MSRGNFHRKSGVGDVVGQCMLIGGGPSGAIGSVSGRIARQVGILRRFSDRPLLHASIFQSVMPGCNRPMSIGGLHRNDRHSFRIESSHMQGNIHLVDFRKLTIPSIIRKISFQTMQVSIAIQRYEINFPLSLCICYQ